MGQDFTGPVAAPRAVSRQLREYRQGLLSSNFPVRWLRHADGCAKRGAAEP